MSRHRLAIIFGVVLFALPILAPAQRPSPHSPGPGPRGSEGRATAEQRRDEAIREREATERRTSRGGTREGPEVPPPPAPVPSSGGDVSSGRVMKDLPPSATKEFFETLKTRTERIKSDSFVAEVKVLGEDKAVRVFQATYRGLREGPNLIRHRLRIDEMVSGKPVSSQSFLIHETVGLRADSWRIEGRSAPVPVTNDVFAHPICDGFPFQILDLLPFDFGRFSLEGTPRESDLLGKQVVVLEARARVGRNERVRLSFQKFNTALMRLRVTTSAAADAALVHMTNFGESKPLGPGHVSDTWTMRHEKDSATLAVRVSNRKVNVPMELAEFDVLNFRE